ncbi:MAG: DUF4390 domain-containing protein [Xanthomonadales bacterium]|nr:DUF4390 domain-containing protein [Xanthomonadales bacterium]
MPAYARGLDRLRPALLAALLPLAACADRGAERFELTGVAATWTNGQLRARCEQRLTLSREARDALHHGVPLTLEIELILRDSENRTRVGGSSASYEVHYLPLSKHYRLSYPATGTVKTFPRLRHVLAELSRVEISLETGPLPGGEYQLLARSRLDKSSMPPPMRLPALLSRAWRHDSNWSTWPLEIAPDA